MTEIMNLILNNVTINEKQEVLLKHKVYTCLPFRFTLANEPTKAGFLPINEIKRSYLLVIDFLKRYYFLITLNILFSITIKYMPTSKLLKSI